MAKVKIVNRENLQSGSPISGAQPLSNPLSVVGKQVSKIAQNFENEASKAFISNEVTSRYADYIKGDSDYTGERSQDVNGFQTLESDWTSNSVKLRNTAFKGLTDPDAQRILNERITSYSTRQGVAVKSLARKQSVNSSRIKSISNMDKLKEQAIAAKNADLPEIMAIAAENMRVQVETGIYTKEQGDIFLKKYNGEVQEARIYAMIRENPSGAHKLLSKTKSIPGISQGRHFQLQRIAKSMARQNQAVATQQLTQLQNDDLASIKRFGKGVPNLLNKVRRLGGSGAAAKYQNKQKLAMKIYEGNSALNNMSIPEINKFISVEAAKVKAGAGFRKQQALLNEYVKTARARIKLITEDPVKAINQSLVVKINKVGKDGLETDEAQQMQTDAAAEKFSIATNPLLSQLSAFNKDLGDSLKVKLENTLKTEKVIAIQKANDVDAGKIRVLENGHAKEAVTAYNNVKASEKVAFFQKLRSGYSKEHYRFVLKDLVKNGLPVEAMVIDSLNTNAKGTQLAIDVTRAIELGPKLKKDVPKEDIDDIDTSITSALNQYTSTIYSGSQSALVIPYVKDLKATIQKIALVKMQALQMDPAEAGKLATDEVINSRYNFYTKDSAVFSLQRAPSVGRQKSFELQKINIRIPKEYDVDSVVAFTAYKFKFMKEHGFMVKPGLKIKMPGAPVERRRKVYMELLEEGAQWVNNSTDDGVILIDSNRQAVVDMEGKKFGFKFSEMDYK